MIPAFDERGNLPPGIHKANWEELEARLGGTPWRRALLIGVREALESLRAAGCRTAYVNGSFASSKEAPHDFDVCWEPDGVDIDALDVVLLNLSDGGRAQKRRFGGELFPADMLVDREPPIAILDFFQRDRATGWQKGILELDLETGL